MAPVLLPVSTALVFLLRRAFLPRLHHLQRERQLLCNDKARVQRDFALGIAASVPITVENLLGVDGHRNGCSVCNPPFVEQPFERDVEVLDGRVGINENDEAVRLEELGKDVRLDPRVVQPFHGLGAVEFVVVAMNLGYNGMSVSSLD